MRTTIQFRSAFDRGNAPFLRCVINIRGIILNVRDNKYWRFTFVIKISGDMKFLRLKSKLVSKRWRESYGRCVDRMKPFLLLFKLCGIFANEITGNRLKRCSRPFYSICVFWLSIYVSYLLFLLYHFTNVESIQIRLTIEFVKHLIGYISLSVNVIAAYVMQDGFIKVRKNYKAQCSLN